MKIKDIKIDLKKLLLPALILVIIAQLCVPVYMMADRYDTLKNGEEYKFKVRPVDPYDAFRGRYVDLYLGPMDGGYGKYGIIKVDSSGFAKVKTITNQKPKDGAYIKSGSNDDWFELPIDRYYMDEKLAPKAEELMWSGDEAREAYVTVRVKNGKLVVSGLYVDGQAIEDVIKNS
ncbi:MAG: GDYXXLXY domain-containing protein [Oscillospiraceae bacterium]|nr:GDYXXLXY domain-containing protein [Oscillospiraceae bacterium]